MTKTDVARPDRAQGRSGRNSKVELLRVLSMWFILAHHFVIHNADAISLFPSPLARAALSVLAYPMGRPAVAVFVIISVWYLLDRDLTPRSSLRRIWLLDRQLIVYSLAVVIVSGIWGGGTLSPRTVVLACLPLLTNVWWFATDYALLLLFLPFLVRGMRALGRDGLRSLSILVLVLFGVLMCVPKVTISVVLYSPFVEFLAIAVLTAYVRWHVPEAAIRAHAPALALTSVAGLAILAACWYLQGRAIPIVSAVAGGFYDGVVTYPMCLLSLMISVPVSLIALTSAPAHWPAVNALASVSFGVYLLTDNVFVRDLLWKDVFAFSAIGHLEWGVLLAAGVVTGVYLAASAVDAVRQLLFGLTVDRHRGRLFDRLADAVWREG